MACFCVHAYGISSNKRALRNKGNDQIHEHHHRENCNKTCTFVMFLDGVNYQSLFPFQVLNFYFDMHVKEERKRKEQLFKRDTGQGLGLFECGEYFYKGGQLIDRQL